MIASQHNKKKNPNGAWTCLRLALLAAGAFALPAHALQIVSVSPQGEVSRIRQIVAKFDQSAVNFGDPKAPAPLSLTCSDAQATKGNGRWISDREWAFEFDRDLPPGVRCTLQVLSGIKSPSGAVLSSALSYTFNSGGPFVQSIQPSRYQRIDEEQFFLLRLNGPATLESIKANVWCAAQGLGEKIPVRLIEGQPRNALLEAQGYQAEAAREPLAIVTLACNRRLTPDAKIQIVYGKGVTTPSGVANSVEKRFDFQVREPFAASFSCERENAQSACLPIRPMRLDFNAPVSRKLASAIRLKTGHESLKPEFEGGNEDDDSLVNGVSFGPLYAESAAYTLELPQDFKDASGRTLRNAGSFPLKVATGAMPPLAKFSASPFGIVERFAEPGSTGSDAALLPVTLRNVEAALQVKGLMASQGAATGKVSDLKPRTDAEIIAWYRKVKRYDDYSVPRKQAATDVSGPLPEVLDTPGKDYVQSRMLSLLAGQPGVKTLDLPKPEGGDPRPFEVVGIPLSPGFHVVEIASQSLGSSLLDERYGAGRTMYVRTSALVTNLGVHFKLGRENSLAWVTSLDKGMPVGGAVVRVSDCQGRELASATTNAQGIAQFPALSPEAPRCRGSDYYSAYFVSARKTDAGVEDLSFTWSDWHKGIEPWRFNVPTSRSPVPDERAHTIFDRTLVRAGETVSMKHLLRTETSSGFGLPETRPDTLVITHVGSGQQYTQDLAWRSTPTGGQSAENRFQVPPAAKLGVYTVELKGQRKTSDGMQQTAYASGQFRVEEFRLPVLEGKVKPVLADGQKALIDTASVPVDVQINYVSGGAAVNLPVRLSALVRSKYLSYSDYDDFNFSPPGSTEAGNATTGTSEEETSASQDQRVIADKLPLTLDRNGAGRVTVQGVPPSRQPQELLLEASYSDPNGEVQTIRNIATVWPAGVVVGIKTEGWVSSSQKIKFQALALDLAGKPTSDVSIDVKAVARIVTTSRKRMVGGFYTYDNKTETKDLGSVCSGRSDSRGLLLCETKLDQAGEVELVATAKDPSGHAIQAASSVYVTRQGELWFGGENHDRMDELPEKKSYQPGETAKFQVRMPFRFAPRWWPSNAKASSRRRWFSSTARIRPSASRSRTDGDPMCT